MTMRIFFIDDKDHNYNKAKDAFKVIALNHDIKFYPNELSEFHNFGSMISKLIDSATIEEINENYLTIKTYLDNLNIEAFIIDINLSFFSSKNPKKTKLADTYGLKLASFLEWGNEYYGLEPLKNSKSKIYLLTSMPYNLSNFKETCNRLYMNRIVTEDDINYLNIYKRIKDRIPDINQN